MPSTSAKQHRFMAAIANNPTFAKKAGVSQSVGKDFIEADKGKKFGAGGKAKIGKQNTTHGEMDMPFKSLRKFTGMKAGGAVRRYAEGGDVDSMSFAKAFREKRNELGDGKTFTWRGKSYTTNLAKRDTSKGVEERRAPLTPPSDDTRAVTRRTDKAAKRAPSDEQKEKNAKNFAEVTAGAASMLPIGRAARTTEQGISAAMNAAKASRTAREAVARAEGEIGTGASGGARSAAEREAALDAERASSMEGGYRKGGSVKESKEMVKKEVSFMKKAGAPKSMIRHEESEAKGMKAGGMARSKRDISRDQMGMAPYGKGGTAKYARGGGVESRGKTKGTIIKMAGGGFVRSADGVAQRGKTKATQIRMKKGGMCK